MTTERKATHNSTYPKGGVLCSADTFVQAESLVLRMKLCSKSPALRVAANRWRQGTGRVIKQSNLDNGETEHRH